MKLLVYAFIIFSVAFSIFTVVRILFTFQLFDFVNVYYPSIQDILHSRNLYHNPLTDVNYPPTTFLFLFPFGLIPIEVAQKIWTILSFSALIGSIFVILKAVTKKLPLLTFLLIYSFAMLSFPVKFTFGMGQINLILLFLLSLCFLSYQRKKSYLAGIFLGVACAIKLTPVFLLLFFLRKRAFRVVASVLVTILSVFILAMLLFGQTLIWQYFTSVLPNIPTVGNSVYYNQALTGFLARMAIPNDIAGIINYLFFAILLVTSFVLTSPKTQKPLSELMEYGIFITVILIGAGLSWQHHFVLLIIPYTALFLSILVKKEKLLLLSLLLFLSYLLVAFNIKNPEAFSGFSRIVLSHVLYGAIVLYFLLANALRLKK